MLRLEERNPRVRLASALREKKPDDDTGQARETVKEWNYCPSHVILAFCFVGLVFLSQSLLPQLSSSKRALSAECLKGGQ